MKILYDKIISVEDNSEEWFKALLEVDDVEFVKHNVEYRLGENLNDKILWKLYINFLKEYDFELMLHTYLKYRRYFTEDEEMKTKFEDDVKVYNKKSNVTWKGMKVFELNGIDILKMLISNLRRKNVDLRKELFLAKNIEKNRKRKAFQYFSSDFAQRQNFSFQKCFINYIFQTSNSYLRQELFKSCKYFYSKYPFPLCYKLSITLPPEADDNGNIQNFNDEIVKESLYIQSDGSISNFLNLHVTDFFNFESSSEIFKNIFKKIYRCTATAVSILHAKVNLTFNELKFLIGHGNVIYLDLCEIECTNEENGKSVPME
uniref:Uncharacterized protein n=1 Tax=Panagrolaimus davidi TaxID=227884 RepID=A0A914QL50_9BILA